MESHGISNGKQLLNGELDKKPFEFMKTRFDDLKIELDKIISAGEKLSKGITKDIWKP